MIASRRCSRYIGEPPAELGVVRFTARPALPGWYFAHDRLKSAERRAQELAKRRRGYGRRRHHRFTPPAYREYAAP